MIKEAYVSFEVAKQLKEKGFNEWCNFTYGISVRHNGEEIDEDEEFELKVAGRKSEIEYIEGGHLYRMTSNNTDFPNAFAAPTHQLAMAWLRKRGLFISIIPQYVGTVVTGITYVIFRRTEDLWTPVYDMIGFDSYEDAVESAILYCLENLI